MAGKAGSAHVPSKADETRTFVFLTVFLAPILAVGLVGGFGFLVWMSQLFLGPPTG
ncbi:MAG: periplasmic nitrate reductase, NapE protein [Rhodospirillales bacterium]